MVEFVNWAIWQSEHAGRGTAGYSEFLHRSYHGPGAIIRETPHIIHVMGNSLGESTVTIHFYSPPLKMKNYEIPEREE